MVVVHVVRMGRRRLRRRLLGRAEAPRHDRLGHQSVPAGFPAHAAARGSSTRSATSRSWPWSPSKLAELTGDERFNDYWKFVREGRTDVYLQRILDLSTNTKGYKFADLEAKAKQGVPALMNSRTIPKAVGYEQVTDSRPWYTKSGRLEFYREEDEFIEAGENLPVHREPIDSTFYEPNVIVAPQHEALRPAGPEEYGVKRDDLSCEVRCGRNVVKTWAETKQSPHPLMKDGFRFIFHTPKYRHGAHTTPIDTDMIAVLVRTVRRPAPARQARAVRLRRLRRHQPGRRQGAGRRGRRLRVDRRRSRRPAVPRLAEQQRGLRVRPAALPGALLPRHAAGSDTDVVQHVRRHARLAGRSADSRRRAGQESADELPGDVSLRLASVGHARLAQAHLDDRFAGPQDACSARRSAKVSCPTSTARPGRRAKRS